jgi:adenosine deaminase
MSTPRPAGSLEDFVAGLPKAELHLHLEGTLEPELRIALAERNGVALPHASAEEVRASYRFDSLASFLAVYYPAMDVLRTEQDFTDLAWAYLQRAAAQGVRRAEVFFDPQAHTGRGVPFAVVVDGLWDAVRRAPGELGVDAALVMCFLRDLSAGSAMETLEASLPHRERIVGVGLDSDERDNPPVKFAEVFARAREAGYRLTMHCDVDQPGTLEHLRQVLEVIDVDRIDHGSNVVEDPALLAEVVRRGLGLTACPISNGFVTAQMKGPELVQLLRAGAKVTVNSDDPAYFGGYVAENLVALARAQDLTRADLVRLARNSFEVAWVDEPARARYLAELDAYAAAAGVDDA